MARYYDFTFQHPSSGTSFDVRGSGNTRRSAERNARGKLRRDQAVDPSQFIRVGDGRFAKERR